MFTRSSIALAGAAFTLAATALQTVTSQPDGGRTTQQSEDVNSLVCVIYPTEGNECRGVVRFTKAPDGVHVVADLKGLSPNSTHGFHIHEFGDATAADGSSAGGHYNPDHHDHALPAESVRHAGDLGNVKADAKGNATVDLVVHNITLNGQDAPIIGRGVIVHAKPDDGGQPTGNAGARIGIGVIGIANPGDSKD